MDIDDAIQLVSKLNWQTIVAMFVISWYFTHEIKKSMQRQNDRTDKLYEMFIDLLKEGKK